MKKDKIKIHLQYNIFLLEKPIQEHYDEIETLSPEAFFCKTHTISLSLGLSRIHTHPKAERSYVTEKMKNMKGRRKKGTTKNECDTIEVRNIEKRKGKKYLYPKLTSWVDLIQIITDNEIRRIKSLAANQEVLSSNPTQGEKIYHSYLMFPVFKV